MYSGVHISKKLQIARFPELPTRYEATNCPGDMTTWVYQQSLHPVPEGSAHEIMEDGRR